MRSRQEREAGKRPGYKYALIGAEAIYYELRELGVSPLPPVRTIHSWLKQAGFIQTRNQKTRKPSNLTYPVLVCKAVNSIHEFDLKGPFYLKDGSQKYYLAVVRDVYGKKIALQALTDKEMEVLINFLVAAWQSLGCSKLLQMDNGLEFRGNNRYPRSLEKLETAINSTHRLPALDGKTPQEFSAKASRRAMPSACAWRKRTLRLLMGKVAFIRLVRKSGRITLTAKDKFFIGKKIQMAICFGSRECSPKTTQYLFE